MLENLKTLMDEYVSEYESACEVYEKNTKSIQNDGRLSEAGKKESIASEYQTKKEKIEGLCANYIPLLYADIEKARKEIKKYMMVNADDDFIKHKTIIDSLAEMPHSTDDALELIKQFRNDYFLERYALNKLNLQGKYLDRIDGDNVLVSLDILDTLVRDVHSKQNPTIYSGRLIAKHGEGGARTIKKDADEFYMRYSRTAS